MGEDPREEKGEDLGGKGGKDLNQGKRSWGEKRRRSQGGKGLRGGKGGKDLSRERRGKILGRRRSGGKGRRGERGEMISTGKGGKGS